AEEAEEKAVVAKEAGTQRLCACCGAPISEKYEICEICGWEDDPVQNRDPEFEGGANQQCLNEYRKIYMNKKAAETKAAQENKAE
ncbi:MAG: hypothetical protein MJ117_09445, partial [Lachnospiraceae bacterium]|nr:hypothetical protein [Lachnospiraceae bacterium]